MKIYITEHAQQRYSQRNTLKERDLTIFVNEIWEKGKRSIDVKNTTIRKKMGNILGNEQRKIVIYYKRLFFVFKTNDENIFLITVINPPKL